MPRTSKLPFRSSSVKVKGSGLFSRGRSDGGLKTPVKSSSESRHRPLSSLGHEQRGSELQRLPLGRESRSHESVQRPLLDPLPPPSRRGRSPPRRRSTYRSSLSPPSHRNSPRDERLGHPAQSPPRRRYSSAEVPRPRFLSPNPPQRPSRRDEGYDRHSPGNASGIPAVTSETPHHGDARGSDWASRSRSKDRRYPPSSSSNHRPQMSRRTSSPQQRADIHRPHSSDAHGQRLHHSPAKPATSPSHASGERGGVEGFFKKFPTSFATYAGIRALSEHADKAKEWAEWFNNVNGAPDEIRSLSSRVSIARDTIKQIQSSLEARPDLIEDESGQALKVQIEDAIDSTRDALRRMTQLLASFNGAAQQDGTTLGRLEGFWHSFNYKNSGEEQVRDADAELQQQLIGLTTLMSNIYARALKSPGFSSPGASTPNVPTPQQSTTAMKSQDTLGGNHNPPDQIPSPAAQPTAQQPTVFVATEPNLTIPSIAEIERDTDRARNPVTAATSSTSPQSAPKTEVPPSNEDPDTNPSEANATASGQDPRDALLDAAWDGDLHAVRVALKSAHPNSCDTRGLTALHLAAERDHLALAMLLLDSGADVHARADGGCMPIHLAARYASAATVELLIERGADVDARTTDGRTPLHYAAKSADGNAERREVIRTLRQMGANPTLINRRGETARDVAQARDFWDAAAILRRAEQRWEAAQEQKQEEKKGRESPRGNWLQRHGFMKK